MPLSDRASFLKVKYVALVCCALWMETPGRSFHTPTSRSGFPYASGRSSTPLISAKIAIAAPSPRTSVVDAVIVNAGDRLSDLQAGRAYVERSMSAVCKGGVRTRDIGVPFAYAMPPAVVSDLRRLSGLW